VAPRGKYGYGVLVEAKVGGEMNRDHKNQRLSKRSKEKLKNKKFRRIGSHQIAVVHPKKGGGTIILGYEQPSPGSGENPGL